MVKLELTISHYLHIRCNQRIRVVIHSYNTVQPFLSDGNFSSIQTKDIVTWYIYLITIYKIIFDIYILVSIYLFYYVAYIILKLFVLILELNQVHNNKAILM